MFRRPELAWTAIGAWLVTHCDVGGSTDVTPAELAEARRQVGLANNNPEDTLR